MASPEVPPTRVLSQAFEQAIGGEPVVAAIFATFQLDTTFFEDHILAPLFSVADPGSLTVRRALLAQKLTEALPVVVLYDGAKGLLPAEGSHHRATYVPVRAPGGGCFHTKNVLLLLGSRDAPTGLVLGTTSANLTESGWWENVECADVRRLAPGESTPLAPDLAHLLDDFAELARTRHVALDTVRAFIDGLSAPPPRTGPSLPRLWTGRESLPEFLREANLPSGAEVELAAPYVDDEGAPVRALTEVLAPSELRVMLPLDRDENPHGGRSWHEAIEALDRPQPTWGALGVERSLGARADGTRFVHAKLVRVRQRGRSWTLVGSPNLSVPGIAGWRTETWANVETAILVEGADDGPWLAPTTPSRPPPATSVTPPEEVSDDLPTVDARLTFDWSTREAAILVRRPGDAPLALGRAGQVSGRFVAAHILDPVPADDQWHLLAPEVARTLETWLRGSNLVSLEAEGHRPRDVMLEELAPVLSPGRGQLALTASQILQHWSLLGPEARAEYTTSILGSAGPLDPEAPIGGTPAPEVAPPTMFDAFAGVIHGFIRLRERLRADLEAGRAEAVVGLMWGQQLDSVPSLLRHVLALPAGGPTGADATAPPAPAPDPVYCLVVLLCAVELRQHVRELVPGLESAHPAAAKELDALLEHLDPTWEEVLAEGSPFDPATLRAWTEANWRRGNTWT